MSRLLWVADLLWVAGGRDYTHVPIMRLVLKPYADAGWTLITGAQRGADLTAETIWKGWECPYVGVPARWGMRGRSAGPARNTIIARTWKPKLLLHFPGGVGTANAMKTAESHEIETLEALTIDLPGDTK